jgi:hypothetical protein
MGVSELALHCVEAVSQSVGPGPLAIPALLRAIYSAALDRNRRFSSIGPCCCCIRARFGCTAVHIRRIGALFCPICPFVRCCQETSQAR